MSITNIDHYIGGKIVAGTSGRAQDVFNPATGALTGKTALASASEVDKAVAYRRRWHLSMKMESMSSVRPSLRRQSCLGSQLTISVRLLLPSSRTPTHGLASDYRLLGK